jgi:hypothetical protein
MKEVGQREVPIPDPGSRIPDPGSRIPSIVYSLVIREVS